MKNKKITDWTLRELRTWFDGLPNVWRFHLTKTIKSGAWHGNYLEKNPITDAELRKIATTKQINFYYYGDQTWSEEQWLDIGCGTALELEYLSFLDVPIKNWEKIGTFKTLKTLHLSTSSNLRYKTFKTEETTKPLQKLRNLTYLSLSGDSLGQLNIQLKDLIYLPLQNLSIQNTVIKIITNQDAKSLQYLKELKSLDILFTQIRTLNYIWELPNLKELSLPPTISQSEIEAFKKAHPNCEV